jgi:ATP-dependent exoDNAse (exonuclease V) alpha subunit
LQGDGFANAQTVSKLLDDKTLQNELKNQVLWVDEAGLLSNKDMISLIELTSKQNARLILGGDTRQHSAVQRGDALRILNKVGKIKAAEVNKIFRQQNDTYRQTVQFLADGKVGAAFQNLERMGAIAEIEKENPQQAIVNDYLSAVKSGQSSLVIAPTHQEGELVTKAVRNALKAEGLIDQEDVKTRRLTGLNFTIAQKTDWRNIEKGQVIQFSQNSVGIKRGSQWKVVESTERDIIIANEEQKELSLPVHRAEHYDVFAEETIDLAKGDSIRITRNGIDRHKDVMSNGQIFKISQIHDNGDIEVENSKTQSSHRLPKDFGHLAHAHCITSHASQGQTVDQVFVSVSASSFGATNLKQMYVSVSRGRHGARIYTDDRAALMQQASKAGDRESALELVIKHSYDDTVRHQLREQVARNKSKEQEPVRAPFERPKYRSRGYEPGI